jgi:hypothetical protein
MSKITDNKILEELEKEKEKELTRKQKFDNFQDQFETFGGRIPEDKVREYKRRYI